MERTTYIVNAVVYCLIALYIYRSKWKGRLPAFLIACLFAISSVCSVLYYDSSLYSMLTERMSYGVSITSLGYLLIGFLIYLYPLTKADISNMEEIPEYPLVTKFAIFLGLLSILPFIENMTRLLSTSVMDMAMAYEDNLTEAADTRSHFSFLGRMCNGVTSWFSYFTPVLSFYMLATRQKTHWIILSFVALVNPMIPEFFHGGRGALFHLFCTLALNFIIFRKYFSEKVLSVVTKVGVVAGAGIALFLVAMSVARASGDDDIALQQVYRYLGESFVNFSEAGWYVTNHTGGHSIFNGTGHTWLSDLSEYFESRDYTTLGNITGVRMYVYYTVFGDYFFDFGIIGGILFNLMLALIYMKYAKEGVSTISAIIILNMYAKIGFNGIYCFAYMNRTEFVLFTFLCLFALRRYESSRLNWGGNS